MLYSKTILASFLVGATASNLFVNNTDSNLALWETFKKEHGKTYSSEENAERFNIFVTNLQVIDKLNAGETGSATYAINEFADISSTEFANFYLNAQVRTRDYNTKYVEVPTYTGSESMVDWTGIYTTPVKNQKQCGSCWAFSATEQIESDAMRQLGSSYVLSPMQVTQCTPACGCGGGWTEAAYDYVRMEGGIEQEEDYPYEDIYDQECKTDARKEVIGIRGFNTIYGEENMASYMKATGPLSVCISAVNWQFYHGGIMENCPMVVDHCVQAVGVDDSTVGGYWKLRNSWGPFWGEEGYIRISYGSNTCFITNDPTYTDTFLVN